MYYKQKIKHCVANRPHLYKLRLCLNLPTPHIPCFHLFHNPCPATLLHDPRASVHSQSHLTSHHHKSHYHKLPQLDHHLRIRRLHPLFPFPENTRTQKRSFTHASFISMVVLLNLARNRTRSHGSCHTCKPVRLEHGANTSWFKYLKRPFGTTRQTTFYKKFNDGSATLTNVQRCPWKSVPWCKEIRQPTSMYKISKRQPLKPVMKASL